MQTDQISIQQIYRRTPHGRDAHRLARRLAPQGREAETIAAHAAAMREDFATPHEVMEHDIAFHEAIAAASHNPMFALIVGSFHVVTRQTWRIGWVSRPDRRRPPRQCRLPRGDRAAIGDRDARAAEATMAEHFDNTVKVLLAAGINLRAAP